MQTGNRTEGRNARAFLNRGAQGMVVAGLLGLAPLAASSAAAPDATAMRAEPATSSSAIELVPVQPAAEVNAPAAARPLYSSAQETILGRGSASYYAARFEGQRTASGERFDNDYMTAAHRTLPFGSLVRVINPANGRSVVVRINDRGPFSPGRIIDVSRAAAAELGMVARGHATVELALIED
jgi:rare lipoprotein A